MTSSSSTIIRIPRTDTNQEDDFILGEVTHSGAGGSSAGRASKPLNLKIVATEGEEPYALTLKHDTINSLRSSSSSCTPAEWESILSSLLITASPISDIETGAEVESRGKKKSITITIRRRVAGINQRLGALTLSHSPSSEIQLFDWCSQLAISRQTALSSLSTSAAQVADLEARVADLKAQLEELTQAKVEQETELLQKFRALLNEKKGKIRQQQQVLSSRARSSGSREGEGLSGVIESARAKSHVTVSQTQPDEDEEREDEDGGAKLGRIGGRSGTGTAKTRTARVSRSGKRKATKDVSSSDEDDDGDAEKMEIDSPEPEPSSKTMGQSSSSKTLDIEDTDSNKDEDEEDEESVTGKISGRETPDRDIDDDETASEPDEEDEMVEAGEKDLDVGSPASPPPARKGRGAASATTPPQKKAATATATPAKGKGKETPSKPTPGSNTKRAGATATRASQPAVAAKAVEEGSETESDDEL